MFLVFVMLLTLGVAANPVFGEPDSVFVEISPELAVIEVRYQPAKETQSARVADGRQLYQSVNDRLREMQDARIKIELSDFSPYPSEKGIAKLLSSSPYSTERESGLECSVLISLATGSAGGFWDSATLIAQVLDAIEKLAEEHRGLKWRGPEYRIRDLDRVRPALYQKVRDRLDILIHSTRSQVAGMDNPKVKTDTVFHALIIRQTSLSKIRIEMPFETNIEYE